MTASLAPFGVLADDLTGACDTGAAFSARGARVRVQVAPGAPPPVPASADDWDVLVQNTESRHLPPAEAGARVAQARERLTAAGWPVRYKKIDSTLRGPWLAEARPLLAGGALLAVNPAFPAAGRTVAEGVLRVNGVPVHETALGRDRLNPVPESHLPTVLAELGVPVALMGLAAVGSAGAAVARLAALRTQGAQVGVADAETDAHLAALAAALLPDWRAVPPTVVAMGSAGLANALAAALWPQPADAALPLGFPCPGPVLVVAGSLAEASAAQVRHLAAQPGAHALALQVAVLDAADWDARAPAWVAAHAALLRRAADAGAEALLVSVAEPPAGGRAEPPGAFARRSTRLNAALGAIVASLAAAPAGSRPLGGLVLTGGDIARAALSALGAEALQLGPLVLPGIPLGWPVAGAAPGLPLVTKAGGFGDAEALATAVHFLRHGRAPAC